MALLINQEIISPNKGTLPNFYLKIENFNIDKINGLVRCISTPYRDSQDALLNCKQSSTLNSNSQEEFFYDFSRIIQSPVIYNSSEIDLPREHEFFFTKPVQVNQDIYETVETEQEVPYYDFDAEGNVIELTRSMMVSQQVKIGTEIVDRNEIDLSLINPNPYNWIYSNLKKEYEKIFGTGNVLDI